MLSKRGVLWTGLEKVLVQGIGFAQGVVLARLLKPGDFGLAAMLYIFLGVGSALAESGLGMAYVVYGRNSKRVFWWNVGIGAAIYSVLASLAPVVASFYGEPILKPLLWVMGLGIVLNAACVLGNARLQRERKFGQLSAINVATTLVAFIAAVVFALYGYGVWAIAWMGIVGAVLRLVALATVKMMTFASDDDGDFGKMLGYGLKLTFSELIHTAYVNSYNLIVGKMFTPSATGLFARGRRWSGLPTEAVNETIARVALPDMSQGVVSARRYILLNIALLYPALAFLWIFADAIIGFVLGDVWLECVPYVRIMILGVAFSPITNVSTQYIKAKGRSDLMLWADGIRKPVQFLLLAGCVCTILCRTWADGILLLCWTKVACDIVDAVVCFGVAWRLRWKAEEICLMRDLPFGDELKRRHDARELDRFFEGQSIAVVGNGPSDLGRGLGNEIDAHDVVVRFNNYRIDGFERDYGSRADVWVKCGAGDLNHEMRHHGINAVLYIEDIMDRGMLSRFVRYLKEEIKNCIVDYIDEDERRETLAQMSSHPTAGAFLIHRLSRIKNITVDVYGFAFLESDEKPSAGSFCSHYSNDVTPDVAHCRDKFTKHDLDVESAYLRTLFNGRRMK